MDAPLDVTLDRFEAEIQAAEAALKALDERQAVEDDEIGQLEARVQALSLEQDVPTESDLRDARRRRDDGWGLIRSAWFGGNGTPGREMAESFEQSQARAD